MGYVNNTAGYDQKKVRKYGKLYGTIDFEINDKLTENYVFNTEKPVVGKLHIGNRTYDVTYQELDMIQKTLHLAKETINRAHKMGMLR